MMDFEQNLKILNCCIFQLSLMGPNLLAKTYWITPLQIGKKSWTQNISYEDFDWGHPPLGGIVILKRLSLQS